MMTASVSVTGQWVNLDAFMRRQIESGWWTVEERAVVLEHLERTGFPGVKEEAWSIEGLSERSAQELMLCEAWLRLVAQGRRVDGERNVRFDLSGSKLPLRSSQLKEDHALDAISFRMRNSGKWGIRYDEREATRPAGTVSGYLQSAAPNAKWKCLIGGHRLGWGHRLTVNENSLFSGVDDPVFVLPITYDFVPAWGISENVPRNGIALARQGNNWSGAVSVQKSWRDAAWICRQPNSGWGAVGHVESGKWRVGAFKFWSHSTWQGLFEWAVGPGEAGVLSSWQSTPSRSTETHGRLEFHHSFVSEGREVELLWGGQQWSENGKWRTRWRVEWNPDQEVNPIAVQLRRRITRDAFWEIRAEASQFRTLMTNPPIRRFDFRGQFEGEGCSLQLRCYPRINRTHPGGVCLRIDKTYPESKLKFLWAVWEMDDHAVGYFPDLSPSGLQFRPMRGSGFRCSMAWRWRPSNRFRMELIYSQSNRREQVAAALDMLTSGYAQTGISASLQVRL